jgi:hypothetical protein
MELEEVILFLNFNLRIYKYQDIGNYDEGVDKWWNFVNPDTYSNYFIHCLSRTKFSSGTRNPRYIIINLI